jgi:hypothetical protein
MEQKSIRIIKHELKEPDLEIIRIPALLTYLWKGLRMLS